MSKKNKRQTYKSKTQTTTTTQPTTIPSRYEFNPDYNHVLKDLRTIGILAGSLLVIMVILSFFL